MNLNGRNDLDRTYSVHGLATVRIHGPDVDLARELDAELSYFRTERASAGAGQGAGAGVDADIDIRVTTDPIGPEFGEVVALGDGYFYDHSQQALLSTGMGGGSLFQPGRVKMAVRGDLLGGDRFRIELKAQGAREPVVTRSARALLRCDPMTLGAADAARFFYRVFEPLLYLILPKRGATLLHAGAVAKDGRATLVFGVRDVGKTSTTIDLVRRGYEFMADDLCILRSDGTLLSYPKPMKIEGDLLENREWNGRYTRRLSAIDRWVWFLAFHSPRRKPFWLSLKLLPWQLNDSVKVQASAALSEAIFLWKSNGQAPEMRGLDRRLAAGDALSHLVYEFNGMPRHHAYFHALGLLRRSPAHDLDAAHIARTRAVIESGLAAASCHEIVLGQGDNFATASRLIRGMADRPAPLLGLRPATQQ